MPKSQIDAFSIGNAVEHMRVDGRTIDELLAFHRARFGDLRMEDTDDGTDGAKANDGEAKQDDAGEVYKYPADTALADMTEEQRTEYWREKAQKHEKIAKRYRNIDLDALQAKASKHDELERELMSDKDKAVEDAKAEARREATEQTVVARMDAAAARVGMTAEKFAEISEWVDPRRFVNTKGDVDLDAINRWAEANKPSATEPQQQQRGPSPAGAGAAGARAGASVAAGRAEYEAKKAAKAGKS